MTKTFKLDGMHCTGCANTIQKAIRGLAGVKSVFVELESKEATVEFDESKVTTNRIIQAVSEAGYTASL